MCKSFRVWFNIFKLNSYDQLLQAFPLINHSANLKSRLALYRSWQPDEANVKKLFLAQVLEYAVMGYIIELNSQPNSIIVASDHRSMRPYYNLVSSLPILSRAATYD